jgi:hypothetical protein
MWNLDRKHEIMYFYYHISTEIGSIRLFLYLFLNERFSGVEFIAENDQRLDNDLLTIIQPYRDVARAVMEKRDRLRKLLE